MEAILFKDGIEFKRGQYPNIDGSPVEGLSDNLEWKLIIRDNLPTFNSKLFNLVITEDNTEDFNATYPHLKEFRISYSYVKKDDVDLIEEVEKAEAEANASILNNKKRDKFILLGLGILIRKSNGITITANEETILNQILSKASNVWQNDVELQNKLDEIANDVVPNLTSGWVTDEN